MSLKILGLSPVLFGTDVLIKQYVEENLDTKEEKELFGGKLVVRKVYNKGFLLNALDQCPKVVKGMSLLSGAVILAKDFLVFKKSGNYKEKAGMTLLTAGAFSNIFDRLVRGKVIDYIGCRSRHAFLSRLTANLGDFFVLIGSILMIGKKKEQR